MNDVVEKPVYKTGDNVGSIISSNEAVVNQPVAPTPTPEPTPAIPVVQPESNASNFSLHDLDTPAVETPAAAPTPQVVDWKEAIKKADLKEVLKELGVDEFAIEIHEHRKNGGDVLDYLNAKAIDYNKISDENIIKTDLQKQYPTFSPQQIDLMFKRKYSVSEDAEPEDKEFADLQLKADAHNARQSKITEQQKFKIPTPQVANNDNGAAEAEHQRQIEAGRQWFAEHEATKSLLSSKRVTLSLGDNGNFNFNIERPELLMQAVTDGETWQKLTLNKQGEPDVAKMQKIALYAFNPEQFEADLVNYGKSLALPQVLKESQNVTPGARVMPMNGVNTSEKELWKNAKSGTIGGSR